MDEPVSVTLANITTRLTVGVRLVEQKLHAAIVDYLAADPLQRWCSDLAGDHEGTADVLIVDRPPGGQGALSGAGRLVVVLDDVSCETLSSVVLSCSSHAVVLASEPMESIGSAIEAVVRYGGGWASPDVLRRLRQHLAVGRDALTILAGLTTKEQKVVRLVVSGRSNTEVARELHVAETTVGTHMRSILRKTGCANRHQLVARVHGVLWTRGEHRSQLSSRDEV